jgi:hypothetical protein
MQQHSAQHSMSLHLICCWQELTLIRQWRETLVVLHDTLEGASHARSFPHLSLQGMQHQHNSHWLGY